ncbi:uncharacterized protein LOC131927172 [Physella acuta]|uniref:uncharacterized protein LOC131927172 n=1 Tax=Physella acuta TaxID=109671 RepID=UPI0027DEA1ED|nr:uncharacterized protein LOC131927172 [Physella acuta]
MRRSSRRSCSPWKCLTLRDISCLSGEQEPQEDIHVHPPADHPGGGNNSQPTVHPPGAGNQDLPPTHSPRRRTNVHTQAASGGCLNEGYTQNCADERRHSEVPTEKPAEPAEEALPASVQQQEATRSDAGQGSADETRGEVQHCSTGENVDALPRPPVVQGQAGVRYRKVRPVETGLQAANVQQNPDGVQESPALSVEEIRQKRASLRRSWFLDES